MAVEHCPENIPSRSDVCFYHPLDDATAFAKDGTEVEWAGDMRWDVPDVRVNRAGGRGSLTGPQDYLAHPTAQNVAKVTAMAWARKVTPPVPAPVLDEPIHAGDQKISGTGGVAGGRIMLFTRPPSGGSWTIIRFGISGGGGMTNFAVSGDAWESITIAADALPQEHWEVTAKVKGPELDAVWSEPSAAVIVSESLQLCQECGEIDLIFFGDSSVTGAMPAAAPGWNPGPTAEAQLRYWNDNAYGGMWMPASEVHTVGTGSFEIDIGTSWLWLTSEPDHIGTLISCRVRESDAADWCGAEDGSDGALESCAQPVQSGAWPEALLCEGADILTGTMPDEMATNDTTVLLYYYDLPNTTWRLVNGALVGKGVAPDGCFEIPATVPDPPNGPGAVVAGDRFALRVRWQEGGDWIPAEFDSANPENPANRSFLAVEAQHPGCGQSCLPEPPDVTLNAAWSRRWYANRRSGAEVGHKNLHLGAMNSQFQPDRQWDGRAIEHDQVVSEFRANPDDQEDLSRGGVVQICLYFGDRPGLATGVIEGPVLPVDSQVIGLEWTPDGAPHTPGGTIPHDDPTAGYHPYDGSSQVTVEINAGLNQAFVTFAPPLEDQRTYRMTLKPTPGIGLTRHAYANGPPMIEFRSLVGDVTGGQPAVDWKQRWQTIFSSWTTDIGEVTGLVGDADATLVHWSGTWCGTGFLGLAQCCFNFFWGCRASYTMFDYAPDRPAKGYFDVNCSGEVTKTDKRLVTDRAGRQSP